MTKLARAVIFAGLAAVVSVGLIWYGYFRPVIVENAVNREIESLSFASRVLESGGRPEDWENRVFLPTASLHDLGQALKGLEFVAPQGQRDEAGRYDGAILVTLNDFFIATGTSQLRPRLSVTARYEPDRVNRWWSGADVDLIVDAIFMPAVRTDPKTGKASMRLLVVPTSIRPSLSWNPFKIVSAGKVVSEIVAAGVLLKYGEELALVAPALSTPLKIETKIDSKSWSKFDKEGGYDLLAKLDGPTFERPLIVDVPLVTSQGFWMLGQTGRPLPQPVTPPASSAELQGTLEQLREAVADKLKPFDRPDGLAEVRVSNRQLLEIADEMKQPWKDGTNRILIGSANADGKIAETFLLKDNLLGDVGLRVTPRVRDFLSGEVNFHPPQLAWVPGTGLTSTVTASAKAKASTDTHVSTGNVGGGIGKDIDLFGETSLTLPVALKLERRVTASGTALVLQPQLGCTRVSIDLNAATREDIIKEAWIALKPFGVRVKRNVGGGQQTPSVLIDSLPAIHAIGEKPEERKDKDGPYLRRKDIQVSWAIEDAKVESDGLSIRAMATVQPTLVSADELNKQRETLKKELRDTAPNDACAPDDEYALLLLNNQIEIGSNNEVVVFIKNIAKEGGRVAEETKKEIEKLSKTPFQSIVDAPDNIIREGGKGLENVAKGIADAGKKAGDSVKNSVCGEKEVLGKKVTICP